MTLDEVSITDQKIAVGLVENPCCWALRDLAAVVPADEAIVELGAFKGRSTGWLTLGAQSGHGARVHSVDPWDLAEALPAGYISHAPSVAEYALSETRQAYESHLDRTGIRPHVTVHQSTAVDAAEAWSGPKVGLLWHDALHRLEDVWADLSAWLPHMADRSVIVLHDVGDPRLEVEAGAAEALADHPGWDWQGREIHLWPKQPDKRGYLIVRTKA